MSKTIARLKARHPEKVAGYYRDCDGLWVDLHYGWQLDGCHTIHTDTVREALAEFARVEPCECPDCVPWNRAEYPCPGCGTYDPEYIDDNGYDSSAPDYTLLCRLCSHQWYPNAEDPS